MKNNKRLSFIGICGLFIASSFLFIPNTINSFKEARATTGNVSFDFKTAGRGISGSGSYNYLQKSDFDSSLDPYVSVYDVEGCSSNPDGVNGLLPGTWEAANVGDDVVGVVDVQTSPRIIFKIDVTSSYLLTSLSLNMNGRLCNCNDGGVHPNNYYDIFVGDNSDTLLNGSSNYRYQYYNSTAEGYVGGDPNYEATKYDFRDFPEANLSEQVTNKSSIYLAVVINSAKADQFVDHKEDYTYDGKVMMVWIGTKIATISLSYDYEVNTSTVYNINYNLNGGTNSSLNPSTYTYDTDDITLANPTREGYTFSGWYTTPTFDVGSEITSIPTHSMGEINLYAKWSANTYTVSFNANGGSGVPSDITATYDASMPTITSGLSTRTGYVLSGYFDSTDGGNQYYNADGTSAHNWDKTTDTTLYANWVEDNSIYTITLDKQNDTSETDTIYLKHGEGWYSDSTASTSINSITKPTHSNTNYNFGGYYTDVNGGGEQIIDGDGNIINGYLSHFTSNATLYAYWVPNVYTITLDQQDGSGGTDTAYVKYATGWYSNSTATASITSISKPSRTGYSFGGYYLSTGGDGEQIIDANGNIISSSGFINYIGNNTTLYAYWTLEPVPDPDTYYNLSYNLSGVTLSASPTSLLENTYQTVTATVNNEGTYIAYIYIEEDDAYAYYPTLSSYDLTSVEFNLGGTGITKNLTYSIGVYSKNNELNNNSYNYNFTDKSNHDFSWTSDVYNFSKLRILHNVEDGYGLTLDTINGTGSNKTGFITYKFNVPNGKYIDSFTIDGSARIADYNSNDASIKYSYSLDGSTFIDLKTFNRDNDTNPIITSYSTNGDASVNIGDNINNIFFKIELNGGAQYDWVVLKELSFNLIYKDIVPTPTPTPSPEPDPDIEPSESDVPTAEKTYVNKVQDGGDISIKIDLHGQVLNSVILDGIELDNSKYQYNDGVLIIKNSAISELSSGEHSIKASTIKGSVTITVDIIAQPTENNNNIPLVATIVIISSALLIGGIVVGIVIKGRAKIKKNRS